MRTIGLIFALFWTGAAAGQPQLVIHGDGAEPGTYYVRVDVGADGAIEYSTVDEVLRLHGSTPGGGDGDGEGEPDDQPPSGAFGLIKVASDAVRDVPRYLRKGNDARQLAATYMFLAERIGTDLEAGEDSARWNQVIRATRHLRGKVLAARRSRWDEWSRTVGDRLLALEADGRLSTTEDMQAAYEEIAQGLGYSQGIRGASIGGFVPPELWERLFELLLKWLEEFLKGIDF